MVSDNNDGLVSEIQQLNEKIDRLTKKLDSPEFEEKS